MTTAISHKTKNNRQMNFETLTLETLKQNTSEIIKTDPLIKALFDAMVISWGAETPPYGGNFQVFHDFQVDCLDEIMFNDLIKDDCSMKEMMAINRTEICETLMEDTSIEITY